MEGLSRSSPCTYWLNQAPLNVTFHVKKLDLQHHKGQQPRNILPIPMQVNKPINYRNPDVWINSQTIIIPHPKVGQGTHILPLFRQLCKQAVKYYFWGSWIAKSIGYFIEWRQPFWRGWEHYVRVCAACRGMGWINGIFLQDHRGRFPLFQRPG